MALRRFFGFSDGELMRSDAKPCSRLMRQTAGIFTVGGALGFWVLCRLHYGPRVTVPRSLRWAGCGAVSVSSTTALLVRLFSPEYTELLSEFSHHVQNKARINNGSFGCRPNSVLSAQQKWQLEFLKQSDDFYFNGLKDGILKSRLVIKDLVNADHVDEISIVDNATTATAIVLQSVAWEFLQGKFNKGDAAVTLQYATGAVKKSLEAYIMRADGICLNFSLCLKPDDYYKFRDAVNQLVNDKFTSALLF